MKKKLLNCMLACAIITGLTGCGVESEQEPVQETVQEIETVTESTNETVENVDNTAQETNEGEDDLIQEVPLFNGTMEDVKAANTVEALMKNHSLVSFNGSFYADEDVDNGYLGFDRVIFEKTENGVKASHTYANQSEPATEVISQREDGVWIREYQGYIEVEVTEYANEAAAYEAMNAMNPLQNSSIIAENIVDVSWVDEAQVLQTEKFREVDGEAITAYYWIDPETLELYAINETSDSGTVYGRILTVVSVGYDTAPDFTIEIVQYDEEGDAILTETSESSAATIEAAKDAATNILLGLIDKTESAADEMTTELVDTAKNAITEAITDQVAGAIMDGAIAADEAGETEAVAAGAFPEMASMVNRVRNLDVSDKEEILELAQQLLDYVDAYGAYFTENDIKTLAEGWIEYMLQTDKEYAKGLSVSLPVILDTAETMKDKVQSEDSFNTVMAALRGVVEYCLTK